jgi:hypothetical protein
VLPGDIADYTRRANGWGWLYRVIAWALWERGLRRSGSWII